jgi:hypothetical protein
MRRAERVRGATALLRDGAALLRGHRREATSLFCRHGLPEALIPYEQVRRHAK